MNANTLSWEDWQGIITVLREKGLDSMLAHADRLEQMLEQHGPDEPMGPRASLMMCPCGGH